MFPNITFWALKLISLTEDSHSMFFDPRFRSYSPLNIYYSYSGQLAYETCATNLHTISMSQEKVVQIKLYSSFSFLNEAVDQYNGEKRVTFSSYGSNQLASDAHVILARHLCIQGAFRKVLLVGQAMTTLGLMTLSSSKTVQEI